jgi:hypothetical protein
MKKSIACAIGIAAGTTIGSVGISTAGPLPVDPAIRTAAATNTVDVRYYGYGGGLFAGLAIGMIGAAVASQYYYPPYYSYPGAYYYPRYYGYYPRAYYGSGYYYPGYAYGPYYRSYGWYGGPALYRHRVIRHYRVHHY